MQNFGGIHINKIGENLQGKTIAVYGASSSIGRKFTEEAATRGAFVIAVARNINKLKAISKKKLAGANIEVIQGDITQRKDVRNALRGRNVDITVNFAASFSADVSKSKAVNVYGEQNILDASLEFGVKRHIYISTIATLIPKANAYGKYKAKAEEKVKAAQKKGLEWIILRFSHVLGTPTWDQPFKIIIPYLRIGVPKVPTDAKKAVFRYLTIDTAIDATLAAMRSRPNQLMTIYDGEMTIGKYLSVMENIYHVRLSFLPLWLLKLIDRYFSRLFPSIAGISAAVEFLAHPPVFENETMKKELKIRTRNFQKWIKSSFSNAPQRKY